MTASERRDSRISVALVCTAAPDAPGSMRAYAECLVDALGRHAKEVDLRWLRIGAPTAGGRWSRRLETVSLPWRAWRRGREVPDVWHVLDGSRAYVAGVLGGAPCVVTAHDLIPWLQSLGHFPGAPMAGRASTLLWRLNARSMRKAELLVCDSESTARDARNCFGIPAARCRVVPLPLRPALVPLLQATGPIAREPGLVLHVGNNGFYKWRDQVLRIFAALDPALARRLVMAGPEPTPEMRALSTELGIADRVEWSGDPDDRQLADLYRRSALLLFPSRYEGYGWPVLEAMSFGLPVVSSNRGSLPEVAGDACPCLDPEDITGMAEAASAVLSDPGRAVELARSGLHRAAEFSSARLAAHMLAIYRESARYRPGVHAA